VGKTLVIAEKPSVARDLVKALGGAFQQAEAYSESSDYIVSHAIGHLVQLADPEEYSPDLKKWRFEDLPIIPDSFKLKAYEKTRAQLAALYRLFQRDDVELVINACDAGREGELIFAYIYDITKAQQPVSRLWISSMTTQAIQDGFAHLREGAQMKPLEAAARSRSEADWLVGMNATRAATLRGRGLFEGVVSLGRVQTPTLAMIVNRDLEIDAFKTQGYFVVKALFNSDKGSYAGSWFKGEERKLTDPVAAEAIALKVQGKTGQVAEVEKTESQERSPLLYDLTSLQREANSRYGFSADQTLKATQALYETRKAVTYPRTDSRYLPKDMQPVLKKTAKTLEGLGYDEAVKYVTGLTEIPSRIVDDKKVSDHHAIIPTLSSHDPSGWSDEEQKVFDLVARRFLSVFHPPARYEHFRVTTVVEAETFLSLSKTTLEPGWRVVYSGQQIDADEGKKDDEVELSELPALATGDAAECTQATAEKKETKPPRRYTESTLLAAMQTAGKQIDDDELREAMKEGGLGTPATRAATIERLLSVGYIERKGRQLRATDKGVQVIQMLDAHPLTSSELTGQWEKRLADIEKGELDRDAFMQEIRSFAGETVDLIATMDNEIVGPPITQEVIAVCPRCGQDVKETPMAYSCTSYKSKEEPGCGFVIWKEVAKKRLRPEVARELIQAGRTAEPLTGFVSKSGNDFAAYLLLDAQGKVSFEFPEQEEVAADAAGALGACPRCGKGVVATSRAYACSSWKSKEEPGCGFTVWKETAKRPVSEAEVRQLLAEGQTPVLSGFKAKSGSPFDAALVLKTEEGVIDVGFDFPALVEVDADAEGVVGRCPVCGKGVVETARAYSCSSYKSKEEPGCGFAIWKEMSKRKITLEEATALLRDGKTEVLHGFKAKSGSKFSAALILEPAEGGGQKAGFEFPAERTVAADSGAAIGPCPKCGQGVVEKAKSYSCSSYKSAQEPGCGFVIWKEMAKKKIGVTVAKQLLADKRTGVIEGFKSKSGNPFAAALVVGDDGKVNFEFADAPQSQEPLGSCPKCGQPVKETAKSYSCSSYKSKEEPGCGFVVWKEMAKRQITADEVRDLLANLRTLQLLEGFTGRSGTAFSAHLLWDAEEGKVVFDFPTPSELRPRPQTTAGGLVDESGGRPLGFSVSVGASGASGANGANEETPSAPDQAAAVGATVAAPLEPQPDTAEDGYTGEDSPFDLDS
jgi:DNA topoisomerase-3